MNKKIFWVEDDALLGSILKKALSATGMELIHAKNGEEAIDLLKDTVPDLIMVDLLMPGKVDGFGVLKWLHDDSRFVNVPRIVLSNLSSQDDINRAKSLGASTFIVKAASSLDLIIGEITAHLEKK